MKVYSDNKVVFLTIITVQNGYVPQQRVREKRNSINYGINLYVHNK